MLTASVTLAGCNGMGILLVSAPAR